MYNCTSCLCCREVRVTHFSDRKLQLYFLFMLQRRVIHVKWQEGLTALLVYAAEKGDLFVVTSHYNWGDPLVVTGSYNYPICLGCREGWPTCSDWKLQLYFLFRLQRRVTCLKWPEATRSTCQMAARKLSHTGTAANNIYLNQIIMICILLNPILYNYAERQGCISFNQLSLMAIFLVLFD